MEPLRPPDLATPPVEPGGARPPRSGRAAWVVPLVVAATLLLAAICAYALVRGLVGVDLGELSRVHFVDRG